MGLTVSQFIKFKAISEDMPNLEKDLLKLSIIFNKPVAYFEKLSFKILTAHLKFLKNTEGPFPSKLKKVIWIKGTRYVAQTRVSDYSTELWLSLVHYRTIGLIPNLHHILSWIYKPTFINDSEKFHPLKWMFPKLNPEKYANDFLHAKMNDVYGTFFLFLKNYQKWKVLLEYSIIRSTEILTSHMKELAAHQSQRTGDGTIRSKVSSVIHLA